MYQVPPHPSPSTARSIAALVLAIFMFLAFAMSLTELGQGASEPNRQPPQAPAGLGL